MRKGATPTHARAFNAATLKYNPRSELVYLNGTVVGKVATFTHTGGKKCERVVYRSYRFHIESIEATSLRELFPKIREELWRLYPEKF